MGEHRQRVDQGMSQQMNSRVIIPLLCNLGARYLTKPWQSKYDDEEKTIGWRLGTKKHGDKRHRSGVEYQGIHYTDGEYNEGVTHEVEVGRHVEWSVKHDNRLVQNDETINKKKVSYEETFNKIRTFSSLDLVQSFSASAQGSISGIGGSVSSSTTASAHSEIETETFNKKRTEVILDTGARIFYPGPLYRDDKDENGVVIGRTLVEEGPIWLVERPVSTIHTITPITQWGIWDARIVLKC